MSLPNRLALPLAILSLAFLAGCSSSSNKAAAPPTGGFSNSNLSGTYAFSTVGYDVFGAFFAFAGTFTANGSGAITGGALDLNDPALGQLFGQAITGGNYSVGVDGRPGSSSGLITLVTSQGPFVFDYVLSSTSGGLISYYDTSSTDGGSGSGAFALQTTVTQSSIAGQSYAINLSGVAPNASSGAQPPFAIAGAFTLDANGQVGISTTGVEDVNSNGIATCGANGCSITAASINLSTAPGTATFSSSAGTFNFDVYPVSPTQLIFIETDTAFITAGNAFTQSSSMPSGNNVFAVAGLDPSAGAPITAVGLLVTNGNGGITTASTEDVNDAGNYTEVTGYNGSYSTLSGGRSVITLTGFVNAGGLGCSSCSFAAYPSTGGLQLLEIDDGGITDGVAYAQGNSPTFASGEGYGMDLTGSNSSSGSVVEEDDIAEFTNTSGSLSGLIDFNDEGTTTFDQKYTASYAADTTGIPGRGIITAPTSGTVNAYDMAIYVVNTSTAVGISGDSNMIALGTLNTQNATSNGPNAAQQHLVSLRAGLRAAGKFVKRKQ